MNGGVSQCRKGFLCADRPVLKFFAKNANLWLTIAGRYGIIISVAGKQPARTHGMCGRSSSGRAPPCQGGGSEFEPRRPLHLWKFSSAGRASALQAEGHRFEPYCSHHYGLVVQLVRTLACHARGRRFDPDPGRQFASVAQSVEQGTENPRVIGSIPVLGIFRAKGNEGV